MCKCNANKSGRKTVKQVTRTTPVSKDGSRRTIPIVRRVVKR